MAAPKTPPVTRPPDAPPEIGQVIGAALAAAQSNYQPKDDPPVASSGYWDYDESTGKKYWVNYLSTKSSSKATLEFYELDRDELRRFQELAFQAGYYGSSAEREDIPFGTYDPDTFGIWKQYVDRAANMFKVGKKLTVWDMLQDDVNNRPEGLGKKKSNRGPLVTQLPDPREIEEIVRGIAPSVTGRDPDEAFTQDFIAMYTEMVKQFQENKYALENTESGGSITAPPSAEALASFRLRHERPEEFEEKRAASRQQAYTALLKGANI